MFLTSLETILGVPEYVGYIFFFVLGAVIGSFLNVVIHRVPNEESIVFPNSACPKCKSGIKAYDNIPILSWLVLGGKCRNCKNPIAIRYPGVELLTAVVFTLFFWRCDISPILPVYLVFAAAIISLIFIDAEHMILPNVITYPGIVLAFLVRLIFPLVLGVAYFSDTQFAPLSDLKTWPLWSVSLLGAVLGALAGGGMLWMVGKVWKVLRGVDAMGLGDVKMMLAIGALLGWRLTLLSIFFGAMTGAIGGIGIMIARRETMQAQIPFGIFLGLGSLISMLFGEAMIDWYVTTFIP
jgi:leader peptidase (prepilin peptidase)/N-methyltransferase